MRTPNIQYVILAAGCIFSVPVLANVGATNAGVTTTIPQDPTQPSADVQSQSSGFVQQNQQLGNQQNQAQQGQNGIVLPGGVAQSGSQSGTASSANPNSPEAGNNGGAAATPQTPPPPPAPPPEYQSLIKPVVRDTPSSSDVVAGTQVASTAAPTTAVPSPPPAREMPRAASAPIAPNPPAPAKAAPKLLPDAAVKANVTPPANTGGRGAAPDGYTFLLGLLVTCALLAFALVTYLRIGRSGSSEP